MPDPSFFFSEVLMDAAFSTYLFIVYFPHLIVSFKKAGILSLTSFFLLFYLTAFSFFPLSFLYSTLFHLRILCVLLGTPVVLKFASLVSQTVKNLPVMQDTWV